MMALSTATRPEEEAFISTDDNEAVYDDYTDAVFQHEHQKSRSLLQRLSNILREMTGLRQRNGRYDRTNTDRGVPKDERQSTNSAQRRWTTIAYAAFRRFCIVGPVLILMLLSV